MLNPVPNHFANQKINRNFVPNHCGIKLKQNSVSTLQKKQTKFYSNHRETKSNLNFLLQTFAKQSKQKELSFRNMF
jgi:hypothetical protein